MLKKLLFSLALLLGASGAARAEGEAYFHVGYSSTALTGVRCSSGTVVQLNATRPTGYKAKVVGYRVQNQSTGSIWIGGISVSTNVVANLGEMLGAGTPGDSGVWMAGYDYRRNADVPLYCRAADNLGAAGGSISVSWWGY